MAVYIELERFKVKTGKEEKVREWMAFLNQHIEEVEKTLPGEKMYVESIFQETVDGTMYLYWVSYQGMKAEDVVFSDSYIDKTHLSYWQECIDSDYGEHVMQTNAVMLHEEIKKKIEDLESEK